MTSAQRRLDRASRRIHESTRRHGLRLLARHVEPRIEQLYRDAARRMIAELHIDASEDEVVAVLRRHLPPEEAIADAIAPALTAAATSGRDGARRTLELIQGGRQDTDRPFAASASPTETSNAS